MELYAVAPRALMLAGGVPHIALFRCALKRAPPRKLGTGGKQVAAAERRVGVGLQQAQTMSQAKSRLKRLEGARGTASRL
jgi:hypothetical protein